jgi:hypothetical protein
VLGFAHLASERIRIEAVITHYDLPFVWDVRGDSGSKIEKYPGHRGWLSDLRRTSRTAALYRESGIRAVGRKHFNDLDLNSAISWVFTWLLPPAVPFIHRFMPLFGAV